jgi:ABC-type sugar transport systems, permease components
VFIAAVFRVMDLFRKFEGIQQLTGGGPGVASTTLNTQMYLVGLTYNLVGVSAALGIVMVVMMGVALGLLYLALGRRQ